jgi:hypothetical protein
VTLRVAIVLGIAWALTLLSLPFTNSRIDWHHLEQLINLLLVLCSPLIVAAALYRKYPYLAKCATLLLIAVAVNFGFSLPILAAARWRLPLRDAEFAHLDHFIGLSIPSLAAWTAQHARFEQICEWTYSSLRPLILLVLVWCMFHKRFSDAQRLVLSSAYALAIVTAASLLWPCFGPSNPQPLPAQIGCMRSLAALRVSGPLALGPQDARIICFPSFHVCLAVLGALALRARIGYAWAFAIAASALFLGWHYGVDAIAGGLLAWGCYLASERPLLCHEAGETGVTRAVQIGGLPVNEHPPVTVGENAMCGGLLEGGPEGSSE